MNVLNAEQMRTADAHAIEVLKIPSLTLMENAAAQVVRVLIERNVQPKRLAVVCGKGNNGGDGMAVARRLKDNGWDPTILLLARGADLKADPAVNWERAVNSGVRCVEIADAVQLEQHLADCEIVIDAIFGTGLAKPTEGFYSEAIQRINRFGKEVISIDVPSGVSSDTGMLPGPAVRANVTVALAALKHCHVLTPACKMCGETYVVDIGIPAESTIKVVRQAEVKSLFPHRPVDGHKGTFGHAAVIAGSTGKSGAAYMSGKAALRAGAGLVTVLSPSRVQPIVATLGPEIMTQPAAGDPDRFSPEAGEGLHAFLADKRGVAIGPGIGTEESTFALFRQIVPRIQSALVIDADGLNLLARDKTLLNERKASSTILTPHPGEMARLLQTDTATVQEDRIASAKQLASETKSVVVLKGYRTIIADPQGRVWINPTGGQALASAGTGDILTGAITGFLAQKLTPLEAAMAGVYVHGFVANLFEKEYPQQALNAMDIVSCWNRAVNLIRTENNLESEYLKFHFSF